MSQPEHIYRNVSSMEPLLPESNSPVLAELSAEIFRKSGELKASLPSQVVRGEVANLVQEMNSYYSNLIEGHKTLPREIETALQQNIEVTADDKRNRRMHTAHIAAEQEMRDMLRECPDTDLYHVNFITGLHEKFYSNLPEEEWYTMSKTEQRYEIIPGELRDYNVDVGRHTPPDHSTLQDFLNRYCKFYSSGRILKTNRLIAIAAAHHRLAWIHPFGDGNGRVARLHSQACLVQEEVDGDGLWTLSRGLARSKVEYYSLLQSADRQRTGDYDGRGNLSDQALSRFCEFLLKQMLDQIEFMVGMIAPQNLLQRIEQYLRIVRIDLKPRQVENFSRLLKALCLEGEIARGQLTHILDLKSTAVREVIRAGLSDGIISTSSERGPIKIAFPNKVVEYYFPLLFADLPVDP